MGKTALLHTSLPLPLFGKGKVRDTYSFENTLLMVTTDRISAFDIVMANGIPGKGQVLTQMSVFWFGQTRHLINNHLISAAITDFPAQLHDYKDQLAGRAMLVKKAQRIDIECVVRGYLAGSGWKEYQQSGTVCGAPLSGGLRESDLLPEPIFTPATKAASGHDENITIEQMKNSVGEDLGRALVDISIRIYSFAARMALDKGIIIADTKMEFGLLDNQLILIDELLTPDSSRFWAVSEYKPGKPQPSFDKQFLRDYLEKSGWNKHSPGPTLPDEIVQGTRERYHEAYAWITGESLPLEG